MCRWFAYVSTTEDCLLEDVLVTPAHSLSKQIHQHYLPKLLSHDPKVHAGPTTETEISARNRLFNVDGFGMAWYTPTFSSFTMDARGSSTEAPTLHPVLYKIIQPPLHNQNFRSLCANTSSPVVFAHIRAATCSAITPVNNHPFIFGRHTFMHNGLISNFSQISRQMCNLMSDYCYENIGGSTDTEHLAALYITYLTFGDGKAGFEKQYTPKEMLSALEHTINTVIDLQQKALGDKATANSLNIATTDGSQLVAIRFRNHSAEQPPSLYYSTSAGVTLNRKYPDHPDGGKDGKIEGHNPRAHKKAEEHGSHVIVASEPTTYKDRDWDLIEKNTAVLVESNGKIEFETVKYSGDAVADAMDG